AGHEQGRRLPVEIPQSRLGAADELPAAGGGAWVDAGELPGQGDSTHGHAGARRGSSRHVEELIVTGEVAEAGGEPGEGDLPGRGLVAGDHLGGGDGEEFGHLGEVLPVVADIDGDLSGLTGRSLAVFEPADGLFEGRGPGAARVEADEHGAGGGDEFDDAGQSSCLEAAVQRHRRAQILAFDEEVTTGGGVESQRGDGHRRSVSSGSSVMNMRPGECVIANGTAESRIAACGVTPQAQNTGMSPAAMTGGSPKSGESRAPRSNCAGSPIWP